MKNIETTKVDIALLQCNEGQIEGVPANPRVITDERMEALEKSVSEMPDMLSLRELLVYPLNHHYIVLGGNQRLVVCKKLGMDKVPCKIIPAETGKDLLRRIVMVDNEEFGLTDWEVVLLEWDKEEIKEWGVEIPSFLGNDDLDFDFSLPPTSSEDKEEGEPTDLDEEKEDKPFSAKLTFDNKELKDSFIQKYQSALEERYGCNFEVQ